MTELLLCVNIVCPYVQRFLTPQIVKKGNFRSVGLRNCRWGFFLRFFKIEIGNTCRWMFAFAYYSNICLTHVTAREIFEK